MVARYRVSAANSDVADPASEQIILTQEQPFANHNGGQIQFGPDGYLYIGLGDGGSANDPRGNGQNRRTFLAKLLRVDVETDLAHYRVPVSNPFAADTSYLPEIWALGLRNPWRFSFDRATGDLWIGDVGQNRAEEVDFQAAGSAGGQNYGWNTMEGFQCRDGGNCDQTPFTPPILEYSHASGDCSITGGYVYRGTRSPGLRGTYIYADYCSGRIWGVRRQGDQWVNQLLLSSGQNITTFGQDEAGEIYVGAQDADQVSLVSGPVEPVFSDASVVNAASYTSGLVAGSIATVFASGLLDTPGIIAAERFPLPPSLGDVSVTVGGVAAPVYAVANAGGLEQVNFQVPFEVAGSTNVPVVITRAGNTSAPVSVPLRAYQPGIFTLDGRNGVAVFISSNTLVTAAQPVTAGSDIYFYATGLGPVSNTPATGAPAPPTPPSPTAESPQVTLGAAACEVLFAGLAPGLAGAYQVNIRVPAGIAAGSADLVIAIGGASSPPVAIPVQ